MRIGISFLQPDEQTSIWNNGGLQNVFHLLDLFRASPIVQDVFLLNYSPFEGMANNMPQEYAKFLARPADVQSLCDVVFEIGNQLSRDTVEQLRSNGTVVITYRFSNDYVLDNERMLFNRSGGLYFDFAQFDEVWTHAQHINTCRTYWEMCYSAPVRVMPHIWLPTFVDQASKAVHLEHGIKFGYSKDKDGHIAVLEPNMNMVKTAVFPTLICEKAYRLRPELFKHVYVTNGISLAETKPWAHFVNTLDIFKNQLLSTEPRYSSTFFLSAWANTVVAHQWENGLNYLYYDVLYGGYPLVHNSPFLKDVGYYYEGFNGDEGASALIKALTLHESNFAEYSKKASAYLETVMANSKKNIDLHVSKLIELVEKKAPVRAAFKAKHGLA